MSRDAYAYAQSMMLWNAQMSNPLGMLSGMSQQGMQNAYRQPADIAPSNARTDDDTKLLLLIED
jgi:hypothetical protein